MRRDEFFQMLADRTRVWDDAGISARFSRPVQVKTLADLKALGEGIAGPGGQVRYRVEGSDRTLAEIAEMTDLQLSEMVVLAYEPDVTPSGLENFSANVSINNRGMSSFAPGPGYMQVNIPGRAPMASGSPKLEQAKAAAETCTRVIPRWKARKPYPVVRTITKATEQQRAHDRKIRWQTAWLSLLVSAPVGIATSIVTILMTPAN